MGTGTGTLWTFGSRSPKALCCAQITSAPQSVGAVTRSAPLGLTRGPAPRFSPDYARPSPHRATDSEVWPCGGPL